jgi:hypothetical protein
MREEKGLAGKLGKERRKEREFKIYLIADEMEYNLKKENLVLFIYYYLFKISFVWDCVTRTLGYARGLPAGPTT